MQNFRRLLCWTLLAGFVIFGSSCRTTIDTTATKTAVKSSAPAASKTAVNSAQKAPRKRSFFKREKVAYTPAPEKPDPILFIGPDSAGTDAPDFSDANAVPIDGFAAEVDGQIITIAEVMNMASLYNRAIPRKASKSDVIKMMQLNFLRARGRLIRDELILADFRSKGGVIPQQAVRKRMEEIVIDKYDGDQAAMLEAMQEDGMSMREFESQIQRNMSVMAMRQEYVGRPSTLSPKAVRKSYQQRKEEFKFEEGVDVRLILVSAEEIGAAAAREKIETIRKRAVEGESFGMLAKLYSDGPNAKNNGEMGRHSTTDMSPELLAAIEGLEPGDLSEVIEFDGSFGLVEINEFNPTDGYTPFEEVREELQAEVIDDEAREIENEWIRQLRDRYAVVIFDLR